MKKTAYQAPELRDENNNIIQNGAFGRKTAFVTADNQGVLDYIMNDLEALKDMQAGAYMFVDSLPSTGDRTKVYVVKSTGKLYRWDAEGASWVPFDAAVNGVGISSADMDADGTLTLNLTNGEKTRTTFKPLQEAARIVNEAASSANAASSSQAAAKKSEANAKASETNAKTSETNAASSATSASDSASSAASSAASASDSKDKAFEYKTSASNSATKASESALNSAKSAESAEDSYNKTASIQSNFQAVLDTAKASETAASSSATSAASSATAAKNSATAAATNATNANNSETQASEYKASASDSATAAASSASSASESATNAKAAMNTANTAASSASTSATNASTSASNASKSEIAAKTAQAAAEKARDDANSAVTKLTGVMKYAGQVNNYSDLSDVTKNTGDVWNIVNADPEHGIKAGDNVAWNGTDWDDLSGTVDLSIYAEKVDYQKAITSATANGATITFNHKDGTTSTATVNNVASATAATNDAKGQKIDTTYEKMADASNVHTSLQNSINSLSTSKQNKLTFDTTPTADSTNPVTSGGIKTALDGKPSNTGAGASGTWGINISGTASQATKATQDASGNVITTTYATKAELNNKTVDLSNYYTKTQVDSAISTAISGIVDGDSKSY